MLPTTVRFRARFFPEPQNHPVPPRELPASPCSSARCVQRTAEWGSLESRMSGLEFMVSVARRRRNLSRSGLPSIHRVRVPAALMALLPSYPSSLGFSMRTAIPSYEVAVRRKGASQTEGQKSRALEKFEMEPLQVQTPVPPLPICVTLANLSDLSEL